MNNKELSVTQKNTLIDEIAVCIQQARQMMYLENDCLSQKADNMVRVLCLMLFLSNQNELPSDFEELIKFEWACELIDYYSINECNKITNACKYIEKIGDITSWNELLLYAFEAFEYDPNVFINSEVKKGIHIITEKKCGGIFYTPKDVVNYMIDECDNKIPWANRSCLDCSCGTGVFLVEIVKRIFDEKEKTCDIIDTIEHRIWGVDISYNAVINCRFVIFMYFMQKTNASRIDVNSVLRILEKNIVQGNALDLSSVIREYGMPTTYSCIIGNPPYITANSIGNTFIPFVYNIMDFSSENSSSALVIPLSICTGKAKPFKMLRNRINDDLAEWKIINFDRSPDSLFGDHVKTRNTIIVRSNITKEKKINVSGLIRWSSEKRDTLFNKIQITGIDGISISDYIPKISEDFERELLVLLSCKHKKLSDSMEETSNTAMYANATAYNWINVFDHIPESKDEAGNLYVPDSLIKLFFSTEEDLYFYIAMISNRITYWLWTLYGDGFHVGKNFMLNLPYGKSNFSTNFYDIMADLGKNYVIKAKTFPCKSYNCGKEIIRYDYTRCFDIVKRIETEINKEIGGNPNNIQKIGEWYDYHVNCGRK